MPVWLRKAGPRSVSMSANQIPEFHSPSPCETLPCNNWLYCLYQDGLSALYSTALLYTETRSKRSSPMEKEARKSLPREVRSAPHKHLEAMLVADHLYLQKFQNDKEATDLLLTLAHIVRERTITIISEPISFFVL